MSLNKKFLKSFFINVLTISFVLLLLYWTLPKDKDQIIAAKNALREANLTYIFLAVVTFGFFLVITFYRWLTLLRIQNICLTVKESLQLHMAGFFFNTTTPGAVSGDLLKIGTAIRRDPEKRLQAVMSIFMDRLIGLGALLAFVLILLVPAMNFILNESSHNVRLATLIVAAGSICGGICLILWIIRRKLLRIFLIKKLLRSFEKKAPRLHQAFNQIIDAIEAYQQQWKTCLFLFGLSLLSHSCLGLSFYIVGLSLNLEISPLLFILSIQVSNALASVLPLPGGLGLRDSIGKSFLIAAGCPEAAAAVAPLLYSGVILFWGGIGALFFVYWRSCTPKLKIQSTITHHL